MADFRLVCAGRHIASIPSSRKKRGPEYDLMPVLGGSGDTPEGRRSRTKVEQTCRREAAWGTAVFLRWDARSLWYGPCKRLV